MPLFQPQRLQEISIECYTVQDYLQLLHMKKSTVKEIVELTQNLLKTYSGSVEAITRMSSGG